MYAMSCDKKSESELLFIRKHWKCYSYTNLVITLTGTDVTAGSMRTPQTADLTQLQCGNIILLRHTVCEED